MFKLSAQLFRILGKFSDLNDNQKITSLNLKILYQFHWTDDKLPD